MRINTNLNAMKAIKNSNKNVSSSGNSMKKLISGLSINKAADDAAGLAISEKMRSQIRGLNQAEQNAQDGILMLQTAEGTIEEVGNIVQRMRELSVQCANESNSGEDREKIVIELNELHEEIDRISNSTQFNEKDLLNGQTVIRIEKQYTITKGATMNDQISKIQVQRGFDFSDLDLGGLGFVSHKQGEISFEPGKNINYKVSVDNMVNQKVQPGATITINDSNGKYIKFAVKQEIDLNIATQVKMINVALKEKEIKGKEIKLQIGANTDSSQTLKVKIDSMSTESLEISKDDISNMKKEGSKGTEAATKMIDNLDDALERVNVSRGNIGAMQNRLQTASSNLNTMNENLTSIESRIRDVDVAKEIMNLSKINLITQANQAIMVQAKSQPEAVIQLLK
ncbi:flagellin [uncultured Clostridium sp.]|mgnify:FL=1|uniref:flagellin N-terminal helical domain-containing protein n=1 Tax=uncultured Clostridium sp. TaxID=59620 RepID=UPI0025F2D2F5|nr:flagellin [uncultured Clostridium sp.]